MTDTTETRESQELSKTIAKIESQELNVHMSDSVSVNEGMELSTKEIAELIFGASTALSNHWSEKSCAKLAAIAEAYKVQPNCCSKGWYSMEIATGKDGEFIRCRSCGTSFGSAVGMIIANRLAQEENHKKFYENARLAASHARQAEVIRVLMEAAGDLASEVHGCLNVDEHALRQILGHTNFNCLQAKVVRARAAIEAVKESK